jgi:hypothetical protein
VGMALGEEVGDSKIGWLERELPDTGTTRLARMAGRNE